MNKMFKETIRRVKCHPDIRYTFNEYWDIDNFALDIDETNSLIVTQQNKCNRIDVIYWHQDEHSQSWCIKWNEDECVVGESYSDNGTSIDPEQAYYQIAESLGLFK